jgi:hypothetical protein
MLKVFTHPDRALIGMVADIVASNGYECYVRNEFLGGVAGDIPAQECWPELWLLDERDERPARALIAAVTPSSPINGEPWQCRCCGEWLEPQFGACWHCASDVTG